MFDNLITCSDWPTKDKLFLIMFSNFEMPAENRCIIDIIINFYTAIAHYHSLACDLAFPQQYLSLSSILP